MTTKIRLKDDGPTFGRKGLRGPVRIKPGEEYGGEYADALLSDFPRDFEKAGARGGYLNRALSTVRGKPDDEIAEALADAQDSLEAANDRIKELEAELAARPAKKRPRGRPRKKAPSIPEGPELQKE